MDDRTAIRQCRAGNKEAFRHIVERYEAEAIGHAIGILGKREDALDAVQEAFISAYQALAPIGTNKTLPVPARWVIISTGVLVRARQEGESAPSPSSVPV
jgi:Sigma-70 region 2